jgi:hypothetical protein
MIILVTHIPLHITVAGHRVLVSYDGQPMTCYCCNYTGHLYQACPIRQILQETGPISTTTSWADRAARGTRNTQQAREDEEGIARHSGQPELVDKGYEEHCASHPLDGRSDKF